VGHKQRRGVHQIVFENIGNGLVACGTQVTAGQHNAVVCIHTDDKVHQIVFENIGNGLVAYGIQATKKRIWKVIEKNEGTRRYFVYFCEDKPDFVVCFYFLFPSLAYESARKDPRPVSPNHSDLPTNF
jgi:hypothetical protein